jgi:hypothetical protein
MRGEKRDILVVAIVFTRAWSGQENRVSNGRK